MKISLVNRNLEIYGDSDELKAFIDHMNSAVSDGKVVVKGIGDYKVSIHLSYDKTVDPNLYTFEDKLMFVKSYFETHVNEAIWPDNLSKDLDLNLDDVLAVCERLIQQGFIERAE